MSALKLTQGCERHGNGGGRLSDSEAKHPSVTGGGGGTARRAVHLSFPCTPSRGPGPAEVRRAPGHSSQDPPGWRMALEAPWSCPLGIRPKPERQPQTLRPSRGRHWAGLWGGTQEAGSELGLKEGWEEKLGAIPGGKGGGQGGFTAGSLDLRSGGPGQAPTSTVSPGGPDGNVPRYPLHLAAYEGSGKVPSTPREPTTGPRRGRAGSKPWVLRSPPGQGQEPGEAPLFPRTGGPGPRQAALGTAVDPPA